MYEETTNTVIGKKYEIRIVEYDGRYKARRKPESIIVCNIHG